MREGCLRNRFEMGQIMAFGPGKGLVGTPGALGWNQCKKIASGGKWGYIGSQPEGKMEIPVDSIRLLSVRELSLDTRRMPVIVFSRSS